MRRWLAAILVRGPHAQFIRQDLEELYARDRERGASVWRAHGRYGRLLLASAFSAWRAELRWPRLPGVNLLDLKLAGRMLVRHPGLTLVGGLALAVGIPVALAPVQLANAINAPLPFEDADRIVGLEYLGSVRQPQGDAPRFRTLEKRADLVRAARCGAAANRERHRRRGPRPGGTRLRDDRLGVRCSAGAADSRAHAARIG